MNNVENNFIGVFDSGFGGISLLNMCVNNMPNENYVFFADTLNCPYGKKSKSELVNIGNNIINKFYTLGAKEVLIACNTMSTADFSALKNHNKNIHIVGTFPNLSSMIKPNLILSEAKITFDNLKFDVERSLKKVLILATTATCNSAYMKEQIKSYKKHIEVCVEACDPIVLAVENNELESLSFKKYLSKLLSKYTDIDYILLGCTHFIFVEKYIKEIVGDKVQIISGGDIAVSETIKFINNNNLSNLSSDKKYIIIIDAKIGNDRKTIYENLLAINKDDYNITFTNSF